MGASTVHLKTTAFSEESTSKACKLHFCLPQFSVVSPITRLRHMLLFNCPFYLSCSLLAGDKKVVSLVDIFGAIAGVGCMTNSKFWIAKVSFFAVATFKSKTFLQNFLVLFFFIFVQLSKFEREFSKISKVIRSECIMHLHSHIMLASQFEGKMPSHFTS